LSGAFFLIVIYDYSIGSAQDISLHLPLSAGYPQNGKGHFSYPGHDIGSHVLRILKARQDNPLTFVPIA
jgi:hypothetical protein